MVHLFQSRTSNICTCVTKIDLYLHPISISILQLHPRSPFTAQSSRNLSTRFHFEISSSRLHTCYREISSCRHQYLSKGCNRHQYLKGLSEQERLTNTKSVTTLTLTLNLEANETVTSP